MFNYFITKGDSLPTLASIPVNTADIIHTNFDPHLSSEGLLHCLLSPIISFLLVIEYFSSLLAIEDSTIGLLLASTLRAAEVLLTYSPNEENCKNETDFSHPSGSYAYS